MIRKAFLFTALATIIGVSTGGATTVFAAKSGAASGQSKAAMFDKCDKNGDGSLTGSEFKACHGDSAKAEKKFKRLDANHDGAVTREEAQMAHAQKKGSHGAAGSGAGQHGGGMGAPGAGSSQ
jgi:Ca2+-binding EF-hand superfamily protein